MPRRSATRWAKARDDLGRLRRRRLAAIDADEVAHRLGEAFLLQHRERRPGGLVHVDQRRFQQAAEVGAGVDRAAERLHLRHHGVERVLLLGVRVERGGVAVGQAAAGCNRRSARGHVAFPIIGPRASAGVNGETGRPDRRAASSMGSCGGQHGRQGLISGRNVMWRCKLHWSAGWCNLPLMDQVPAQPTATIGAYDAKARLSELLDRVARGEQIVITRHGKPVARLVPEGGHDRAAAACCRRAHWSRWARRSASTGVNLTDEEIRALRDEGRRCPRMADLVLDASVVLAVALQEHQSLIWRLPIMTRVADEGAAVPGIWHLEVGNMRS